MWPARNKVAHWARLVQRRFGVRYRVGTPRRVTIILLSFARPANINQILSAVVLCDFVGEIVISSNNPEVPLERFVKVADSRIRIIRQATLTPASVRFDLSLIADHDDIIAIDDDIFPTPGQLRSLFEFLVDDPGSPHGFGGETWGRPASLAAWRLVSRPSECMRVDSLVWIFAYTKAHVHRYFELLRSLGIDNQTLRSSEDVVLSFAGETPAKIHPVGKLCFCPSDNDDAIATFKRPGFAEHRLALVEHCLAMNLHADR